MDANGPIICIHLQVCRGLWKNTFYQNYLNSQATKLTNTIGKCSYVQLYHIQVAGLCTFFDLCDSLCFLPRLVLALLLLWALLRLEQPANICEPKNWHTSKIIGTTTRETTQTGLSVPKTKAQGSLQGHYKVITRSWTEQVNVMLDTQ